MTSAFRPDRKLGSALAAALMLPLAACGFTPLYGTPGLTPALESMDVIVPHTRVGFLLHEQIDDEFAHKAGRPVRYQLSCTTLMRRFPRGVRVNNVANRYEINFTVNYVLTEAGTTNVLLRGSAPVIVTYDSADQPYAGVAAEQDGELRAASQAAIQMRLQLSRFFAGYTSQPGITPTPAAAPAVTDLGESVAAPGTEQTALPGKPPATNDPAFNAPPPSR